MLVHANVQLGAAVLLSIRQTSLHMEGCQKVSRRSFQYIDTYSICQPEGMDTSFSSQGEESRLAK